MSLKSAFFQENSVHLHIHSAIMDYLYLFVKRKRMKKKIAYIALLVATMLTFSSCLSDDDDTEYTYYGDTAISAFSLGTVNRYLTKKASDGVTDSTVKTTVTGSTYNFVIDQANAKIYNTDSLPYGCDAKHILATISSKNSGYVYIKSLTSDSLTYYSSSDSIDFSEPRTLRVFSQDATRYRDYTVKVNVHQEMEGEFRWTQLANFPESLSNTIGMKAVSKGDSLFLLVGNHIGTTIYAYDGTTWNICQSNVNMTLEGAYKSALAWGGYLYITTGQQLLRSSDGSTWETPATGITQLLGVSTKNIYALSSNGNLVVSSDGGLTWNIEALDSDASLLPTSSIGYTCTTVKTNEQMERIMIVGTRLGDTYATAWSKLLDYSETPVSSKWSYIDTTGDQLYSLKNISNLTVIPYDGKALAFGCSGSTFSSIYQSVDNGITWKSTTDYTLPTISAKGCIATTVDQHNFIWIITDEGQVWRGRLNDLGW